MKKVRVTFANQFDFFATTQSKNKRNMLNYIFKSVRKDIEQQNLKVARPQITDYRFMYHETCLNIKMKLVFVFQTISI